MAATHSGKTGAHAERSGATELERPAEMPSADAASGGSPVRAATEYLPDRPLVLGAGPAGLSVAYSLRRVGISPVLLERADQVCDSWRNHYDGLALNSTRRLSSLPGMLMDREFGPWVARKDLIAYNERYARRISPDIRFGAQVDCVTRDGGGWRVSTSSGDYWSPWVVVALGLNATPYMPPWPGRESFRPNLLHAWDFASAADYAGRQVLVVGVGASGTDIAVQVAKAGARRVWLSVRTAPLIFRRHLSTAVMSQVIKEGRRPPRFLVDRSGILIHRLLWGDLSRYGMPMPTEGLATGLDRRGHGSTVDRGLVSAIRGGHVEVVTAVERLDGDEVVLSGGGSLRPDAVIAATGQRTNLRDLVGYLGVLRDDDRPKAHGSKEVPGVPGMYFLGYRLPAGQLLDMRIDAPAIARRLSRVLR